MKQKIKYSQGIVIALISMFLYISYLNENIIANNIEIVVSTSSTSYVIKETKPCQLLPSHTGPIPVILMALGRSGSSITWDTMARLTGDANIAYEVTGGNQTKSKLFFNSINPDIGSLWPIQRLCQIQERVMSQTSHSGIAGFQW